MHKLIVDVGILVAVELAFRRAVAELVADRAVRHFGTDVEAFIEAEVAAVALAIVRAFEALDAAKEDDFLPLGPADLHDVTRLIIAGADAEDVFFAVAAGAAATGLAAWLAAGAIATFAAAWAGATRRAGVVAAVALFAVGMVGGAAEVVGEFAGAAGVAHDRIIRFVVAFAGKREVFSSLLHDGVLWGGCDLCVCRRICVCRRALEGDGDRIPEIVA